MHNKSQQLEALMLLKQSQAKGMLNPDVKAGLAELIGTEARHKVKEALVAPKAEEEEKPHLLTPDEFMATLESRFQKQPEHYVRPAVGFDEVKLALEERPHFMRKLAKMEESGGEPDIIAVWKNYFLFGDLSAEPPRRNLTYDEAAEMTKEFGIDLMSEVDYLAMQRIGNFDIKGWSWLEMPIYGWVGSPMEFSHDSQFAYYGQRSHDGPIKNFYDRYSYHDKIRISFRGKNAPSQKGGWRGVLKVPKAGEPIGGPFMDEAEYYKIRFEETEQSARTLGYMVDGSLMRHLRKRAEEGLK